MPTYTFQRPDGTTFTKRLSFADYDAIVAGDKKLVDADDNELPLVFNPGEVGFVLKDGESGGWASKAMKENKYRAERAQVMAKRERDHVFKSRLVPNYQGQEASNWSDVRPPPAWAAAVTPRATIAQISRVSRRRRTAPRPSR